MPNRVVTLGRKPVAILSFLALGWSVARCGSDGDPSSITPTADAGPDGAPITPTPPTGPTPNNPVYGENQRQGSGDWALSSPATNREIEGYPSKTSVAPGEKISIFVNTAAPEYTLEIFRLGWYGGLGGRLLQPAVVRAGRTQVTPTPDVDGLVECDWTDPYELTIPDDWVTGMYLAKLTTKGTLKQAYVPFVVRDDKRASTFLVQSSVTTMQAYNNWGGKSLYDFNSTGDVRAQRVSFLRPYGLGLNPASAAGIGAGEIITNLQGAAQTGPLGWEQPMVRFLERSGFDVSYVTNIDVHRDTALVGKHPVFVSMGHDEYWSSKMRDHVEYARDHETTSLAFFSGNVSYWQIRMQPSKAGAPDTTMYCAKDATADPLHITSDAHQTTVRFHDPGNPLLYRGEEGLTGVAFQDHDINAPLVVSQPQSWVYAGTNLGPNATIAGLLGYEVEGIREPPPPGVRVIASSPWTTSRGSGVAHMVTRALPSGAESFAAGSVQVSWGLDDFRPPGVSQAQVQSVAFQQMAKNVLERLGAPRPARSRSPKFIDDGFTGGIDPNQWTFRVVNEGPAAFDPAVQVSGNGGQVTISPRASTAGLHHNGLTSARTFPMMCGLASVELVKAAVGTQTDTTFAVSVNQGNWYRATVEGTTLSFGSSSGGAVTTTNVAYSASEHRHLRIRHDCPTDTIVWETSPDGTTWTSRRTLARSVDLRAAYVELEAGTYGPEGAPGQAIFDNVRASSVGVMDRFEDQRDPEVWTPDSVHEGGYDPDLQVFPFGGLLHLRARGGLTGEHHLGFLTTREYDWTGGVAGMTIVQSPSAATEASLSLAILPQTAGWARITVSAGKIFFQSEKPVTREREGSSLPFDPTNHRHVRIRHLAGTNELVWETSPDKVTWTERRKIVSPFPVNVMRAEVETGTYQAEGNPGEALVDDFVFAR